MTMFKKSIAAGLAILPLTFAIAAKAADTASSSFSIEGTSPQVCTLPPPSSSSASNATLQGTTINITSLTNQSDATVQGWSTTLKFDQVMCNYNAFIKLVSENGGLIPVNPTDNVLQGSSEILTRVNYTAAATWGGIALPTLDTASGTNSVQMQAGGPNQADLQIVISAPAVNKALVASQYRDVLKVLVGIQM